MELTKPAMTSREIFVMGAQQEMAKFERQEAVLCRAERVDCARELKIPIAFDDLTRQ